MCNVTTEEIINCISEAFKLLINNDGMLFNCEVEEPGNYDERKLHEVCINHRLANYIETVLKDLIIKFDLFVDIEFNKEGQNIKETGGRTVRPDIIVHNRKSGNEKFNLLVIECKKSTAKRNEISEDLRKLGSFITDPKYSYKFGLQVIYRLGKIEGTLLTSENDVHQKIIYPENNSKLE
ncbi:MAG: hypothetical protein JW915_20270 [Chitinispirillaceae bacterium]|nr:hypothetical protein [Chitinispirillaceae bacterium]